MKYYKLLLMAVLLTIVGRTNADNLKVANVDIKAGETKEIAIELINPSKKYAAFQFDLVLPEGITIAPNDKGKPTARLNEERIDDHSLTVSDIGSNTYRFLTFSMMNVEFSGTSGALVYVTLQADKNLKAAEKTATIKEQVFTEESGDQVKWNDLTLKINVIDYTKGDVNGDGDIDIADAVCIVNHVVGKPNTTFVEAAADANGDGDIDIADAVHIVNLVVGKIDALARPAKEVKDEKEPQ